ncbi:MAG TPA: phospholipase [Firmicutes bacterium]|nr:phospholipase [Bacillota bacterium]
MRKEDELMTVETTPPAAGPLLDGVPISLNHARTVLTQAIRLHKRSCPLLARIVRVSGVPIQRLLDKTGGTHAFLNREAVSLLRTDGLSDLAAYLLQKMDILIRGTYWADRGWKNASHHYHPSTRRGLWKWPNAIVESNTHFARALVAWQRRDENRAIFFLGAALHIIQDLCVPFHARAIVLQGHQRFELWADQHKHEFGIQGSTMRGIYRPVAKPEEWIKANAEMSYEFFPLVARDASENDYRSAAGELIPQAIRTSAGFLAAFFELNGRTVRPR